MILTSTMKTLKRSLPKFSLKSLLSPSTVKLTPSFWPKLVPTSSTSRNSLRKQAKLPWSNCLLKIRFSLKLSSSSPKRNNKSWWHSLRSKLKSTLAHTSMKARPCWWIAFKTPSRISFNNKSQQDSMESFWIRFRALSTPMNRPMTRLKMLPLVKKKLLLDK